MAAKTFYLLDALAGNYMALQDGGSAPGTATTGTGWTVAKTAATVYSRMDAQTERAASTFGATAQPDGAPDNTLGDCFRTSTTLNGSFASANWSLAFPVIAVSSGGDQDGAIRVRLWRSANADGSGAVEMTAGASQGTGVLNLATSAEQVSTVTVNPGAETLTNEYLFVQVAWVITGAGGATTRDVLLRVGSTAVITTSDFTSASVPGTMTVAAATADAAGGAVALVGAGILAVAPGPAYRAITTMTDQVTASIVVTKPNGTRDGDLLFFAVAEAVDTYTITPPGGWTPVSNVAISGGRVRTYFRVASGEGANYTWGYSPTATVSCHMIAVSGVATSSPLDTNSEATYSVSTSAAATGVTTAAANEFLIGVFHSTGARTFAPPTEMTERGDTGGGPSIEICTEVVASAGATGTRTATVSSNASGAALLAAFRAATAASAPAQGEVVDLIGGGGGGVAGTMTVTEATAPAAGGTVSLAGQGALSVTAAASPAQGGAANLTAASALAVSSATSATSALASTLTAASFFGIGTATASAAGEGVTFDAAGTMAIGAAAAPAQAEAVSLNGGASVPGTLTVDSATAPATGGTVALTAAATFTVSPATSSAQSEGVTFDTAALMMLTAAVANAAGGDIGFGAPALLAVTPAAAIAAGDSLFVAAAALAMVAATATAAASGDFGGGIIGHAFTAPSRVTLLDASSRTTTMIAPSRITAFAGDDDTR